MKHVLLLFTAIAGLFLLGCQASGMVQDGRERERRLANINSLNSRQIVDDWDEFWLQDSNCDLTQWYIDVGH
jgi:hypothetical protein